MKKTSAEWPKWAQPVFSFLAGKKLLIVPTVKARSSQVVTLANALKVGFELEPRVIEVLPAAIIHFPANFKTLAYIPEELDAVIKAIKKNVEDGPDYRFIKYKDMKRWANEVSHDKRLVPAKDLKRPSSFRLSPEVISKLKILAKRKGVNKTEFLESLILGQ